MKDTFDIHNYDDIMNLPHYFPPDRARMPRRQRAAQFIPFSALKGYGEAIGKVQIEIDKQYENR